MSHPKCRLYYGSLGWLNIEEFRDLIEHDILKYAKEQPLKWRQCCYKFGMRPSFQRPNCFKDSSNPPPAAEHTAASVQSAGPSCSSGPAEQS